MIRPRDWSGRVAAVTAVAVALVTAVPAQVVRLAGGSAGGSVSGVVFDSLAQAPLGGAMVQLVDADNADASVRTMTSDSAGRFLFTAVPRGRYLLGFLHPMLDSLGLEPNPREVSSDGIAALRADISIPSPTKLRTALCGADAVSRGDALIIGYARMAPRGAAVDSAAVRAQWIELTLERGSIHRSVAHRSAMAQETGWYAVCGAPSAGTILLWASHGADSTEALELEVPASGFLRRDLYFGTAVVAGQDSAAAPVDSSSRSRGLRRSGDGRLSGIVVSALGGEPLVGARVGIVNGPQTRSDATGRWVLTGAPTGTRMLEVRAVARFPVLMPVDVVDGAAPVRVAMVTLKAVLDTVRVTAMRGGNLRQQEFAQRRRSSGTGRVIGSEDVQRRNPLVTSDLFRTIPGVWLERDTSGEEFIGMRDVIAGECRASVFVNGMLMRGLSALDIDGYVRPADLIGIEVYPAMTVPPQFREQNGCGSVVIWSR
ncbi:MAG: carboxypeptidase regulatory-like domain-containing protein [Gemmatimonadaceae bacterium]|nr:carboxypeptidase regulatory-like domain-containing protein [Gemmatimonadaceae bacterium]